jgi:uncharacterized protein YjbI with pentapeptide repeats
MNLLEPISLNNHDPLQRSLANWAERQAPPANLRSQILRKAAAEADRKRRGLGWILRIKQFTNPYWTGQPLSYAELSRWLFSQALLQDMSNNRPSVRHVS